MQLSFQTIPSPRFYVSNGRTELQTYGLGGPRLSPVRYRIERRHNAKTRALTEVFSYLVWFKHYLTLKLSTKNFTYKFFQSLTVCFELCNIENKAHFSKDSNWLLCSTNASRGVTGIIMINVEI